MIIKQKYLKLILFRVSHLKTLIPVATAIIIVVKIKYIVKYIVNIINIS